MDDKNYLLYKKIFNNKYLSNLIFKFIYQINDDYLNQFHYNKNNKPKYFIKDIPFRSIIKTNNLSLFKDRIKIKSKIQKEELINQGENNNNNNNFNDNLIKLIKFLKINNEKITNQELIEFYSLNKELLFNQIDSPESIIIENCIQLNLIQLLKIIYYDQKEIFQVYKTMYYNCKNDKKPYKSIKDIPNLKYFIYSNKVIIMNSFLYSSLEILKFLNDEIGIDFFQSYQDLLLWSIVSDDRFIKVSWLINDLKYFKQVSMDQYSQSSLSSSSFNNLEFNDDFFNYFFLIDHQSFKKIFKKFKSKLLLNQNNHHLIIIKKCYRIIQEHHNNNIDFKTIQLNGILNLIHYKINLTNSIDSNEIYNKINQLIIYNNNPIEINKIQIDNQQTVKNIEKSKKSKFKLFSFLSLKNSTQSSLSASPSSNSINSTNSNIINNYELNSIFKFKEIDEILKIDYNEFNFEKEIKKLYIFQFLNKKSLINKNNNNNNNNNKINYYFYSSLIYFISKYKEFKLIYNLLESNNINRDINNSNDFRTIEYEIHKNIFIYGNSKLYLFLKSKNQNIISSKFEIAQFKISFCLINENNTLEFINLLSTLLDYNDDFFQELFFIITSYIKIKKHALLIIDIVKKYYSQKKIQSTSSLLLDSTFLESKYISIFFYLHFKNLFSNWSNNNYLINLNKNNFKNYNYFNNDNYNL